MSPSDRAENAALICCHFARNLAYYNASWKVLPLDRDGFWLTVVGNFDSVCTLEWSKLFGNRNGKCHWQKVLKQPDAFKRDFLARHHMDDTNWDNLWKKVKDQETHLHYFPTFEALTNRVEQALLKFANAPQEILALFGLPGELAVAA